MKFRIIMFVDAELIILYKCGIKPIVENPSTLIHITSIFIEISLI